MDNTITEKQMRSLINRTFDLGQAAGIRRAIREISEEFLKFNPALTLSLEVAIESLEAQALGMTMNARD